MKKDAHSKHVCLFSINDVKPTPWVRFPIVYCLQYEWLLVSVVSTVQLVLVSTLEYFSKKNSTYTNRTKISIVASWHTHCVIHRELVYQLPYYYRSCTNYWNIVVMTVLRWFLLKWLPRNEAIRIWPSNSLIIEACTWLIWHICR